jgi:type I restriction enzyme S subunit
MWHWHSINRTLEFQAQTTGIRNLRTPDYLEQEIQLPPLSEQKRIVDLISSVDSYIEALQQQLESAKKSRNAVLHELLNAGGEDWVETTLDGIADVVMGQSPDGKTYNHEGQGLPFMQGSAEFGEHNPVPEKWCSDPKKIAEPGDLLLSVRAPVGDTNFADQRIAVGRGLSIIRANKLSLNEFIRLVIQIKVSELIASSGGGMFASITGKNLKQFKVNLPPLSEQKRIVEIIKTFDEFIAQTFLTTNEAKELKSGLLSDLLSGEHEIPASYDKVIGAA